MKMKLGCVDSKKRVVEVDHEECGGHSEDLIFYFWCEVKFYGRRNGNPIQYSYLKNSMERGALWATVHGVTKSPT